MLFPERPIQPKKLRTAPFESFPVILIKRGKSGRKNSFLSRGIQVPGFCGNVDISLNCILLLRLLAVCFPGSPSISTRRRISIGAVSSELMHFPGSALALMRFPENIHMKTLRRPCRSFPAPDNTVAGHRPCNPELPPRLHPRNTALPVFLPADPL